MSSKITKFIILPCEECRQKFRVPAKKKINLIKFGTNDMTKITVLGGSGFLGSYLAEELLRNNFKIVTSKPAFFKMYPIDEAAMPLPNPDITPPRTKIYLVFFDLVLIF